MRCEGIKELQLALPILLKNMVKAGWLGHKTGKGVCDYNDRGEKL